MSNGGERNPLFVHAIVLFVVAALLVTAGGVGLVKRATAKHEEGAAEGTAAPAAPAAPAAAKTPSKTDALASARKTESEMRTAKMDAQRLTSKPTSMSDVLYKAEALKRQAAKAKAAAGAILAYLGPIAMIAWGALTVVFGIFVLKRSNWARWAGFATVAATLSYYIWQDAGWNAQVGTLDEPIDFIVWRPIVVTLVSGLVGKFLWDLAVEKFEAAPAPAAA